jgi:hypothetical protein
MATATRELRVGERFCGPPGFANGGIACGSLAALLEDTAGEAGFGAAGFGAAAEVTLRRSMPLARPLAARRDDDGAWLVEDGGELIGEARWAAGVDFEVPVAVTLEQAHAVAGRSRYFDDPVFPGCFGCGPARRPGVGRRIFPGPVDGDGVMAAPWTPDPSVAGAANKVRPEVVWAALDCPSGLAAADAFAIKSDTAILLGRMTGAVAALPRPGESCRVVAWAEGRDGRKLFARSAVLGPDDEVLAVARAIWFTVPRAGLQPTGGAAS